MGSDAMYLVKYVLAMLLMVGAGPVQKTVVDPETRVAIQIPEQVGEGPPVTMRVLSDEDLATVNPTFWDTVWDVFTMYDEHMDDRDVNQVRKMEKYHQLFHKKYPEFIPKIHHQ